jgi:hypothetical protein
MADKFPEQPHTKHQPNGEKIGYQRSSQSVGSGHEDFADRMSHPFRQNDHPQAELKPSNNFGKSGSSTQHEN